MKTKLYPSHWILKFFVATTVMLLWSLTTWAQTLPYLVENNSVYPDNQVFVAIVGITDGHVWVDPATGQVHPMSQSDNTVQGPVNGGNQGPGGDGKYANCFRRLSEIPNHTINIPKIAGCRIMISFESQLFLYFFGHSGNPSGYAAPNLANPTDPNQGIKFELVELTFNDYGLWCNTSRVDSYQYPMGLEVWGNGFYKKVGEKKTHAQIISQWQSTAPSEFQSLLNASEGTIHFPTKTSTFPTNFFQSYIDAIWSKYSSQQLVFNSGQAGVWRGSVQGNKFVFTRDGDGQVATIPGKPTTIEAMEGSGVMASGAQWNLVVQAQFVAAITRHAIDLNVGSGVLQDFGNTSSYYQTWPYNWYAKFWHQTDISVDGQTYAFAYDDVFDQSATIHTPSPTNIKITVGGFYGTTGGGGGVATLYQHCDYGGYSASLNVGSYTLGQLQALGVANDDISSLQLQSGYQITMYQHDNFGGNVLVKTSSDNCLVNEGFNDDISSVVVAQVSSGWSTTIEAENTAVQSGTQTEACSEGGLNVGWIDANDWMVWDVNIPSNGPYTVEYRVSSPNSNGMIQLEKAGGSPVYGTRSVPNTGGWQNWTSVSHTVSLTAGQQQIAIKALAGGWNINWLKITSAGGSRTAAEVDIKTAVSTDKLIVYPNPVQDLLSLKVPGNEIIQAAVIHDLSGKQMIQWAEYKETSPLDVSQLKAGHYLLSIKTSTGSYTTRIIKK